MKIKEIERIILLVVIVTIFSCFIACTSVKDSSDMVIDMTKTHLQLAVGESQILMDATTGEYYNVSVSNGDIVTVDSGLIVRAKKQGKSIVKIERGSSKAEVVVDVFDAIVDGKDNKYDSVNTGHFMTIGEALGGVQDGAHILIRAANYNEAVKIDRSVVLKGEEGATLSNLEIADNISVSVSNMTFYSRDYLGEDRASIKCGNGVSLSVDSVQFLMDKKSDKAEDRMAGYAIYVCPNSHIVDIRRCGFSGYKEGVKIEPTDGVIDISSSKFSAINTGIIIDVRDAASTMMENTKASGKVGENVYYNVEQEVEFLFAGATYEGNLAIEKHDKLSSPNAKI